MPIPGPVRLPCHCASLRQAARAITQLYDGELRSVGLTSTQYNLLEVLQWAPEARTSDVAGALAMDSTTVTRSLKLLENAGWIQFQEGVDLREKRWTLTRKGRTKLDSARPCWQQAQDQVEKILGAKQREQLQDLSFKLVKALAG